MCHFPHSFPRAAPLLQLLPSPVRFPLCPTMLRPAKLHRAAVEARTHCYAASTLPHPSAHRCVVCSTAAAAPVHACHCRDARAELLANNVPATLDAAAACRVGHLGSSGRLIIAYASCAAAAWPPLHGFGARFSPDSCKQQGHGSTHPSRAASAATTR
jgi:hypothetical protein